MNTRTIEDLEPRIGGGGGGWSAGGGNLKPGGILAKAT